MTTHGVAYKDVDIIAVRIFFYAFSSPSTIPERHQSAKEHGQFSAKLHGYLVYQSTLRKLGLAKTEIAACARIIRDKLKHSDLLETTNWRCSTIISVMPRLHTGRQAKDQCLVLTIDAMGDGLSATTWKGENGTLQSLWSQSGLSAMSMFYSRITEILGYKPLRHEGKITGLAALAEAPQALVDHFQKSVHFDEKRGRFNRVPIAKPATTNRRLLDFLQRLHPR